MSRVIQFRELTIFSVWSACSPVQGCAFNLTDGDIEEIATALPRLEKATFGDVCSANSCRTTIKSLVSLSTHCRDLRFLEVTTNLRDDLELALIDPRLHDLPTHRTSDGFFLALSGAPCGISRHDFAPVLRGFRRIFPSPWQIRGDSASWKELNVFGLMTG